MNLSAVQQDPYIDMAPLDSPFRDGPDSRLAAAPDMAVSNLSNELLAIYSVSASRQSIQARCEWCLQRLGCEWVALVRLIPNKADDLLMGLAAPPDLVETLRQGAISAARSLVRNTSGTEVRDSSTGLMRSGDSFFPGFWLAHLKEDASCQFLLCLGIPTQQAMETTVLEHWRLLGPHLVQAFNLQHLMDEFRARVLADQQLLSRAPAGFVVLDPDGTIIVQNPEATDIFRFADGLFEDGGRIQSHDPGVRSALDNALAEISRVSNPHALRIPARQVVRPSGAQPYILTFQPIVITTTETFVTPRRRLMVVIVDSAHIRLPGEDYLVWAFGLTSAEARVCRYIVTGTQLDDIAELLSVGVVTVKTHLMHVYQKMQVNSRMALTQLVQGYFYTATPFLIHVDRDIRVSDLAIRSAPPQDE